jgi:hypothetical protein
MRVVVFAKAVLCVCFVQITSFFIFKSTPRGNVYIGLISTLNCVIAASLSCLYFIARPLDARAVVRHMISLIDQFVVCTKSSLWNKDICFCVIKLCCAHVLHIRSLEQRPLHYLWLVSLCYIKFSPCITVFKYFAFQQHVGIGLLYSYFTVNITFLLYIILRLWIFCIFSLIMCLSSRTSYLCNSVLLPKQVDAP